MRIYEVYFCMFIFMYLLVSSVRGALLVIDLYAWMDFPLMMVSVLCIFGAFLSLTKNRRVNYVETVSLPRLKEVGQ